MHGRSEDWGSYISCQRLSASMSISRHAFATISHTHHTDRPPPEQTGGSPLKVKLAVEQLSNLATGRTFRTRVRSITAIVVLPNIRNPSIMTSIATRLGDYG